MTEGGEDQEYVDSNVEVSLRRMHLVSSIVIALFDMVHRISFAR